MDKKKGLNIIFIGLGIVFLFASFYFWGFNNIVFFILSSIVCLSLWIAFIIENKDFLKLLLFSRRGKKSVLTSFNALWFLGIFLLIYLLFFFNVLHYRIDLTPKAVFTLSDKTKAVLKNLKDDIKIIIFTARRDDNDYEFKMVNAFKNESSHIKLEVVNPFRDPSLAQRYGVEEEGSLVIVSNANKPILLRVEDFSYDDPQSATKILLIEKKLVSGIRSMVEPQKKRVGFYKEKGSRSLSNFKANGLSDLARNLLLENLDLSEVDLRDKNALKDLDLLVLAGLKEDLDEEEIVNLDTFVASGKSFILLHDPIIDNGGKTLPRLEAWTKKYGIRFDNDLIIDPNHYLPKIGKKEGASFEPSVLLSDNVSLLPLKEDHYKPYLFTARSLSYTPSKLSLDFNLEILLSSSHDAFGKTDFNDKTLTYNPKTDLAGPLNAMVALNHFHSKQRLIFGGDSAFISNYMRIIVSNREVFKNILLWGLGQDVFEKENKRVEEPLINASSYTEVASYLGFVFLIPLLFLVYGLIVYFYRAKK